MMDFSVWNCLCCILERVRAVYVWGYSGICTATCPLLLLKSVVRLLPFYDFLGLFMLMPVCLPLSGFLLYPFSSWKPETWVLMTVMTYSNLVRGQFCPQTCRENRPRIRVVHTGDGLGSTVWDISPGILLWRNKKLPIIAPWFLPVYPGTLSSHIEHTSCSFRPSPCTPPSPFVIAPSHPLTCSAPSPAQSIKWGCGDTGTPGLTGPGYTRSGYWSKGGWASLKLNL